MKTSTDTLTNQIIDQLINHDSLKNIMVNAVSEFEKNKEPELMTYVVQIMDIIIWPAVLLFILWMFRKEFKGFFQRIKSLKATSTGLEFESFEQAAKDTENLMDKLATPKDLEPPPDPGQGTPKSLESPPDPFTPTDPRMRVNQIQLDLQRKLISKLKKHKIEISGSADIAMLNTILKSNSVIQENEYKAINSVNNLIIFTLKSEVVTSTQADKILELFNKLP